MSEEEKYSVEVYFTTWGHAYWKAWPGYENANLDDAMGFFDRFLDDDPIRVIEKKTKKIVIQDLRKK